MDSLKGQIRLIGSLMTVWIKKMLVNFIKRRDSETHNYQNYIKNKKRIINKKYYKQNIFNQEKTRSFPYMQKTNYRKSFNLKYFKILKISSISHY